MCVDSQTFMCLYSSQASKKDSSLPPQSGEYLKDSFRTEVLAPFATAIVDGFGNLDKRVVQLENTNLLFRILFGTGI